MPFSEEFEEDAILFDMVDSMGEGKELKFDEENQEISFESEDLSEDYKELLEEFDGENNVFD